MKPQPKTQITRREAGQRLGLCLRQIDRLIERGRLKAYKHGRAVRIDLDSVEQMNAVDQVTSTERAYTSVRSGLVESTSRIREVRRIH